VWGVGDGLPAPGCQLFLLGDTRADRSLRESGGLEPDGLADNRTFNDAAGLDERRRGAKLVGGDRHPIRPASAMRSALAATTSGGGREPIGDTAYI